MPLSVLLQNYGARRKAALLELGSVLVVDARRDRVVDITASSVLHLE